MQLAGLKAAVQASKTVDSDCTPALKPCQHNTWQHDPRNAPGSDFRMNFKLLEEDPPLLFWHLCYSPAGRSDAHTGFAYPRQLLVCLLGVAVDPRHCDICRGIMARQYRDLEGTLLRPGRTYCSGHNNYLHYGLIFPKMTMVSDTSYTP